jgi:hypothetical protein
MSDLAENSGRAKKEKISCFFENIFQKIKQYAT